MDLSLSKDGTAYQLCGNSQSPIVVLIHGLGLNLRIWDKYIPELSSSYHVLRYDLYGHGQSGRSPYDSPACLKLYARQLKNLLDELGIGRCTLAGFSIGGMINRRFAMDYRECVDALIILNSPHERTPEQQQAIEKRADDTAEGGAAATLDEAIIRWFTPRYRKNVTDTVDQMRQWVLSTDPLHFVQYRQVLLTGVNELIRPQPPIAVPTLIMTCENDTGSTPQMCHAMAAEIEGAEVRIIPELRHLGMVEDKEAFLSPMMQFLNHTLKSKHKVA